jgi:hydroxypyruvate reductase
LTGTGVATPGPRHADATALGSPRRELLALYRAALGAVDGRRRVREYLRREHLKGPVFAAAVGKAAVPMLRGAVDALGLGLEGALVVAPEEACGELPSHVPSLRCMVAAHPIPDERSLAAGEALVAFLQGLPPGASVLFLTSGGASSLVELPAPGVSLEVLRQANRWLLASGLSIHAMNRVRKALSAIKGGRLARHLEGRQVLHLVIADVPGDDLASIGSGLLVPHSREQLAVRGLVLPEWLAEMVRASPPPAPDHVFKDLRHAIVASSAHARAVVAHLGRKLGYAVTRHDQLLVGDARQVGRRLAERLKASSPGLQVWSGETTVRLPASPGRGGRCQTLALAAAVELARSPDILVLAAGTDGRDGASEDAGAVIDGGTVARGELGGLSAADCLDRADAGRFLSESGDLIHTGPTGTNVMDLVIGLKLR